MRIFENTQIDFLKKQRFAAILSGVLVVLSLVSMLTRGLETGIDFQGGTEIVIETDVALDAVDVRASLSDALGATPEVKEYGEPELLLIRMPSGGDPDSLQTLIVGAVNAAFPGANATPQKVDSVGPRFADDLKRGAIWAVLAALLVIFLYIMVRFEWRFSVGAIVALMHDVIITLGIFSLLHGVLPFSLQIDQAIIAALLTIVGYSLNDTVVIFDRIREFVNLFKTERFGPVVSRSINSTLSRTVVTSGTTLIVVGVLFIFGGEVLKGFAFALIIGVVIGTYSSIFVASPVVIALRARTGKAV
ncbi:MAG: protein translocase subunit SecF [Bacteroidetes bacterium]|nr:protein translocase subunit SecF [Bacteroidota bacterium]